MDNQHRKITGYRDLSQAEIDLMNQIKAHGEQTKQLLTELMIQANTPESRRDLEFAQKDLQAGQMWMTRSVAKPDSF